MLQRRAHLFLVPSVRQADDALETLQHQYATAEARLAGEEATCRQLIQDLEVGALWGVAV